MSKKNSNQKPKTKGPPQDLKNLLKKIRVFIGDDNYIFRGENNKDYGKISSKLYRYFQIIASQVALREGNAAYGIDEQTLKRELGVEANYGLNIEDIQKGFILRDVQEYVDLGNEIEILAELQHYGGATNLIDFSYDLAVALFFACDGEPQKEGRLILLRRDAKDIIDPKKSQNNRTVFQKSVFVKRDDGYIDEKEEGEKIMQFEISQNLKPLLLTYVQNYFGIRTETIFPDLLGYIQNQKRHGEAYKEFFSGTIYEDRDFQKAANCYTKAIKIKPNFSQAYHNRGSAKMNLDPPDLEGAIADYGDAIKLNPNYIYAYNNRGVAYDSNGNYELAIAEYNKAIALKQDYAEAYNNRGGAYGKHGDNDRAIADFTKAIALNLNYANAYKNRGLVYGIKGDNDRAIADLSKVIELNPNDAIAYSNLCKAYTHRGWGYVRKGDYDRAIADLSKVIELNPNYAIASHNRGAIYVRKGDYDRALVDFTRAIELDSNHAEAYYSRGVVYVMKGDHARALADFNKTIELNSSHAEAYNNRGSIYGINGDYANAIANYDKSIELNQNDVDAYENRGVAKKELQDYKGAKKDFQEALRLAEQQDKKDIAARIRKKIDNLPADSDS